VSIAPLYIFFAEYRRTAFRRVELKKVYGDTLYEEINRFDDQPFKDLLATTIKSSPNEVRSSLAWHLWKDATEGANKKGAVDSVSVALRYLKLFVDRYDHGTFEQIYHFIEDHIEQEPDKCIILWRDAISAEHDYVNAHAKELIYHQHWWASPRTDHILLKIRNIRGDQEFLECLSLLLDYPSHLPALCEPRATYVVIKSITARGKDKVLQRFQEAFPYLYAEELANGADEPA